MTGIHEETFSNLQLNAGVFLKDLDWSGAADREALKALLAGALRDPAHVLGATRGGGSFTCKPTLRFLEADGLRGDTLGATVCDRWEVRLSGTLLEVTPENLALCLTGGRAETTGGVTRVTPACEVEPEHYLPRLCWVGDMAGGGALLIELRNVLNTGGVSLNFRDRGEGTLPFSFLAHAEPGSEELPCSVVFFDA